MEDLLPKNVLDELGRAIQGVSWLERLLVALTFAALAVGGAVAGFWFAGELGMYVGGGAGAILAMIVAFGILRVGAEVRARLPARPVPAYDRDQAARPVVDTPAPKFSGNELQCIDDFFKDIDQK